MNLEARRWPDILPKRFRYFLEVVGIMNPPVEKPHLTYQDLLNSPDIQETKFQHLEDIIAHRAKVGIGTNMKTQAQCVFQNSRENPPHILGDPGTWMLDPYDKEAFLAVTKYLIENQKRTELWIGFAMQDDHSDPEGEKDTQPPLVKGIQSPDQAEQIIQLVHGEIEPKELDEELYEANKTIIETLDSMLFENMAEKLAKRLTKIQNPQFTNLTKVKKEKFIQKLLPEARRKLPELQNVEKWKKLNKYLKKEKQLPLHPKNHFLLKIFPQDQKDWKICDIMTTDRRTIIEISTAQFTPRIDEGEEKIPGQKKRSFIRLIIHESESGEPIIYSNQEEVDWILPFLNSPNFLKAIDQDIIQPLQSPYFQIQLMLKLGHLIPDLEEKPELLPKALKGGRIAFLTDLIYGTDTRLSDTPQARKIFPLFSRIPKDLTKATVRPLETEHLEPRLRKIHQEKNLLTHLFRFLKQIEKQRNSKQPLRTSENSILAQTLLEKYKEIEKHTNPLPPSTKLLLQSLAQNDLSNPLKYFPKRAIKILEQQLKI